MVKKHQRVCMPNSLYCFMFYLFLSTEEQIKDTVYFFTKNRHKAQRKAKFYINKCRSASCMQSGLKQASA